MRGPGDCDDEGGATEGISRIFSLPCFYFAVGGEWEVVVAGGLTG
jgi:hypothetical protein